MNAKQAQQFRQLLIEACDHYKEYEGGSIIAGHFKAHDIDGQCPITCLVGSQAKVGDMYGIVSMINSILDTTSFTPLEVWAFIRAFDGSYMMFDYTQYVSATLIGRELRDRYI